MKLHRNKRGGGGGGLVATSQIDEGEKKKYTKKNINRSIFDGYFSRQRKGRAAVSRNLSANRRSV